MKAYEDLIKNTATEDSPGMWCLPTTRLSAASSLLQPLFTLDSMGLEYPKLSKEKLDELGAVKRELLAEK